MVFLPSPFPLLIPIPLYDLDVGGSVVQMLVFGDPVDSNTILSTIIPSLYLSPGVVPKLQIHILLPI